MQLFTDRPEAKQTNPEFPLNPFCTPDLQFPLDGIADMSGHVLEIRNSFSIARDPFPIVANPEVVLAVLAASGNRDVASPGIDTILDELGHRFQRVALGQGDNRDGIPVISNP